MIKLNRLFCAAVIVAMLTACGGGSGGSSDFATGGSGRPVPRMIAGTVPDTPDGAQSRPGRNYRISIAGGHGEAVVFQVFEPRTLTGGERYPLILEGHGFGGSRQTSAANSPAIASLINNGYGVISVDQRGHGESGGTIRVIDPDFEGKNLIAILDWAEANIDWLAYGPDDDAGEDNLLLGSIGLSYGGGYQLVLNAIDPDKRMDAMVPQITWNDLRFSLDPGRVIKAGWVTILFAAGNAAGDGFNFDPFIVNTLADGVINNRISQQGLDFFRYHGQGYFCDGQAVASDGPGRSPGFAPVAPGKVNAMFWQGFRDTLFNFNEAYANYECLKRQGGDVRLLTYQSGHNSIPAIPDVGAILGPNYLAAISDTACGAINVTEATLQFFNEHLKGQAGAADAVPGLCLSLSTHDDLLPQAVTTGRDGVQFDVPAVNLISGVLPPIDIPQPAVLPFSAQAGQAVAGIPHAELNVVRQTGTDPLTGEPILFVGVGRQAAGSVIWELLDNQILPLRGTGMHDVDLIGVAERLKPGDKLALLVYSSHDQYHITGNVSLGGLLGTLRPILEGDLLEGDVLDIPTVPVTVSGRAWLPIVQAGPN